MGVVRRVRTKLFRRARMPSEYASPSVPTTPGTPPPPLVLPDIDAEIRHDVLSDDMRRVHPELASCDTARARLEHLRSCDLLAYDGVRTRFPEFVPPCMRGDE